MFELNIFETIQALDDRTNLRKHHAIQKDDAQRWTFNIQMFMSTKQK